MEMLECRLWDFCAAVTDWVTWSHFWPGKGSDFGSENDFYFDSATLFGVDGG